MKHLAAFWATLLLLMASCGGDDGLGPATATDVADQDQDETKSPVDDNYEYQLPVIFHVLYQDKDDATQYIPAPRLRSLLQYVNEIYRGGIYGKSANMGLRFVLAERDENGRALPTPGVEYVRYTGEYPIDEEAFMSDRANTKYMWDPNEYINVMMYHFKSGGDGEVLGLSHMPLTIKADHQLEGLQTVDRKYISKRQLGNILCSSINSVYAGRSTDGGYFQSNRYTDGQHRTMTLVPTDIVVTLAHELGHYLGLFHIFTENVGRDAKGEIFNVVDSCADTDHCKDTPSYNRKEYNNFLRDYMLTTPHQKMDANYLIGRHACDGSKFLSANVMDYSFTMGYKFSADQKARVRHVLYYSPLIPGPKLNGANKRTRGSEERAGILNLKPRMIRHQASKKLPYVKI